MKDYMKDTKWGFLGKAPIKRKLTWIVLLTTGVALLLASLAIITYDAIEFFREMKQDLSSQAEIIGQNATTALVFHDEEKAAEVLAELNAEPNISAACIYAADGSVIAKYILDYLSYINEDFSLPQVRADGIEFEDSHLVIFHDIVVEDERIGTVYLQYDLKDFFVRVKRQAFFSLIVIVPVFFLAFLLEGSL